MDDNIPGGNKEGSRKQLSAHYFLSFFSPLASTLARGAKVFNMNIGQYLQPRQPQQGLH
jgi:hypothetical protein